MSAHTAGPWTVGTTHIQTADGWASFVVKGPDGKSVACCTSNTTRARAEIRDNGQLIARAPDLLAENERLRAALTYLAALSEDGTDTGAAVVMARAALVRT